MNNEGSLYSQRVLILGCASLIASRWLVREPLQLLLQGRMLLDQVLTALQKCHLESKLVVLRFSTNSTPMFN